MFYSHEILTSREHGVATVWLVATLGSKSNANKVNRKAILDVDVPKACGMIIHPEAPMALRLQGNLLYGVSKVYSQQCGYALVDAQNVKDRMWTMLKTMRSGGLDPDAGKARPEQLVLPHDPTFIPELMLPGLNVDLSTLEISEGFQTPHKKSSLLSSVQLQSGEKPRLSFSSSDIGGVSGFAFASEMSSARKERQIELPAFQGGDEAGILLQPDFEFDEEGNIVELPVTRSRKESDQTKPAEVRLHDDALDDRIQVDDQLPTNDDIEMRDIEDDPRADTDYNPNANIVHGNEENSEVPAVQMRQKRRGPKSIHADDPPELRNSDLAKWNAQYLQNMAVASKLKENNKLITMAKKNAEFWVLGIGIASVGMGIGTSKVRHPLEAFSGEQLLVALTGKPSVLSRRKRNRDTEKGSELYDEERNVRQKTAKQEPLRGEGPEDDDGLGLIYDDIEVGREAPPSLHDDHSSQMPWNITASVQSSRHGSALGSRLAGPGQVGHPHSVVSSGADGGPNVGIEARRGWLTSASPLAGRGAMRSPMDLTTGLGLPCDQDFDMNSLNGIGFDDHDMGRDSSNDRPGADWNSKHLDQESANFLAFLQERVGGGSTTKAGVSFSSLIPPQSNSRVVATEAFLHVLTLATSGSLRVRQKKVAGSRGAMDVGDIAIALTD